VTGIAKYYIIFEKGLNMMKITQEKIFKRYTFIRSVTFVTYLSVILLLSLVGITLYLFREKGFSVCFIQ